MTAYVLWLTLRTVLPEATAKRYLGMTLLLTSVSGLGWFVTFIMPDHCCPSMRTVCLAE